MCVCVCVTGPFLQWVFFVLSLSVQAKSFCPKKKNFIHCLGCSPTHIFTFIAFSYKFSAIVGSSLAPSSPIPRLQNYQAKLNRAQSTLKAYKKHFQKPPPLCLDMCAREAHLSSTFFFLWKIYCLWVPTWMNYSMWSGPIHISIFLFFFFFKGVRQAVISFWGTFRAPYTFYSVE